MKSYTRLFFFLFKRRWNRFRNVTWKSVNYFPAKLWPPARI